MKSDNKNRRKSVRAKCIESAVTEIHTGQSGAYARNRELLVQCKKTNKLSVELNLARHMLYFECCVNLRPSGGADVC
jgi:hypothetical protein